MSAPMLFAGASAFFLSFIAAQSIALYIILSVAVISVYVYLYFVKQKRLHFVFAAFLLFIITVSTIVNAFAVQKLKAYDGETCDITAVIKTEPTNYGIGYSYTAELERIEDKKLELANINLNAFDNSLCPGDRVIATVSLYEHQNKESFYAENIFIHGEVEEITQIQPRYNLLRYKIYILRVYIREIISDFIDGDTGQLIVAVITGDRSGISDETYSLIKRSGVAHMIVVSGMHLSIVCTAIMWTLRRVLPNNILQGVVMLAVVVFIMLLCGFTKSVFRAGITYIILTMALFLKRDGDSLCALSLTVIIVMLVNPFAAYSISFELTVCATYGILVLAPILANKINGLLHTENNSFIKGIIEVICVTVSSNIMTLPIVLYVYEWVSAVSLFTNIFINYSVSAMLVVAIIAVLVGKIQFLAYPAFLIAGLLSKYSLSVIEYLGRLPFATINFNGKSLAAILCMLYLVVFLYYSLIRRKD